MLQPNYSIGIASVQIEPIIFCFPMHICLDAYQRFRGLFSGL